MLLNTGTWEAAAGNKQLAGWRFEMREAMYGNNTLTCPAQSLLLSANVEGLQWCIEVSLVKLSSWYSVQLHAILHVNETLCILHV
jgi:hypothetical protein